MRVPAPSKTIPVIVVLTAAICGLLLYHAISTPVPTSTTPLPAHVYVWQRNWPEALRSSIHEHGRAFGRIVVLARQISWEDNQPHVLRVGVDWDALKAAGVPIGLAIRISTYGGPFEGPTAEFVAQTIRDLRADAAQHGLPPAEIQLDFDSSTAKLPGYRQWLVAAKPAAGGIPLTITTLPAWLDSDAFGPLVRAVDGYVLQVHGLDKPRSVSDRLVLCDPAAARVAIAKAARFHVPFRVALPTYGYAVAFNPSSGQFAGMVAEGAASDWGAGQTIRLAEAQPEELAVLVAELSAHHPAALRGIIWYRLPIEDDRLNWRWPTLEAVMHGVTPAPARLAVKTTPTPAPDGNTYDITLLNTGQRDSDAACRVTLTWRSATLQAADALGDAKLAKDPDRHQITLTTPGGFRSRLRAGDSRPLGWVRLSEDQKFSIRVE